MGGGEERNITDCKSINEDMEKSGKFPYIEVPEDTEDSSLK